eukprot:scaffold326354_cov189-Tisochrysis_lutea.AAC.1
MSDTRFRPRRQRLQRPTHPVRRLLDGAVERNRHVPHRTRREASLLAPHGTLADFGQAPVLAQQCKRSGDEVERQAVEHKAQATAAQRNGRAVAEGAALARAQSLTGEAHAVHEEVLVRTTNARARPDANPVRVLARRKADAAGASLEQRVVALGRPRRKERHVHCAPGGRQGARLLDGER